MTGYQSSFVLFLLTFSLPGVILNGCARFSIREINFYDEKTALENQILGTYREIETEPWLTTSIRSYGDKDADRSVDAAPPFLDEKVLFAFRERAMLADDLDILKRSGTVGESLRGQLILLKACPDAEVNETARRLPIISCDELLRRENDARTIIAMELSARNHQISPISPEETLRILRTFFIKESPEGTMIETNQSEWLAWHGMAW